METVKDLIGKHPFFEGLRPDFLDLISGCGHNVKFDKGDYIFRQGDPSDHFYLLRHGRVALEIIVPDRDPLTVQTLDGGDVLGTSWLVPPYRRSWDARALQPIRAIALDAECLRTKCENDSDLGYSLMKLFVPALVDRLQSARLQVLNVYGTEE